jgi:hypothetical protein
MSTDQNIQQPFTATVHRSVNWTDGIDEVRANSSGHVFAIGRDATRATAARLRESNCRDAHTMVLAFVDGRPDVVTTVGEALK